MEETKINYKATLKKYLSYIWDFKFVFLMLIFTVFLLEILSVIPNFLFKSLIDNGTLFSNNILGRAEFVHILLIIFSTFLVTRLFLVVMFYIRAKYLAIVEAKIVFNLKNHFFNHIIDLDHNFHTTHKSGSLISKLSRGAGAIEGLTDVIFFNFAPFFVQAIIIGASLIYFNWISALIIGLVTFSFVLFSIKMQKFQQLDKKSYNKYDNLEKGNISDIFINIDSIKYFGKNKFVKNLYKKYSGKTKEKQEKYYSWFKFFDSGQIIIISIGTVAILIFPILDFLNKNITLGTLSFIYTTYLSLIGSLYGLVWGIRGVYRSLTDLQDLFDYENYQKEIVDKDKTIPLKIKKGEIEFKNIYFDYEKNNDLFKNFNLKIPANKTIALVGSSGCGKTSLVKLLYRLYNLKSGKILIDGINIEDVAQEELRNELSIVPQEVILFDDTIYNNIKFANPLAKKQDVLNAIKFAQLEELIKKLPKGYNTIVGERGVKLSGGQKQRVSIARAILANKKILILDEATSALDSETEHNIKIALENLIKNRTTIVIAHRLSTIMNADLIVVLDNGKIVQVGTHRELITQDGEYSKLWDYQKGGFLQE
ncbi:MAG: ABC transporter ATP-binding protein [Candidatus Pacearchaeota archaeon]